MTLFLPKGCKQESAGDFPVSFCFLHTGITASSCALFFFLEFVLRAGGAAAILGHEDEPTSSGCWSQRHLDIDGMLFQPLLVEKIKPHGLSLCRQFQTPSD